MPFKVPPRSTLTTFTLYLRPSYHQGVPEIDMVVACYYVIETLPAQIIQVLFRSGFGAKGHHAQPIRQLSLGSPALNPSAAIWDDKKMGTRCEDSSNIDVSSEFQSLLGFLISCNDTLRIAPLSYKSF